METKQHCVAKGGLFHSHKIQYCKQTQELLHRLIEESKLSIIQRQALKASVSRGEPLPGPERTSSAASRSRSETGLRRGEVLVPSALPRRRSYQAIVSSGAYNRECFDPPFNQRMKDREAEKQKLQSLMTFGKEVPPDSISVQPNRRSRKEEFEEDNKEALFDHLVEEIKERLEFLQEMEELGEARAYQLVMEQEIATKMRQLRKIDEAKFINLKINVENKGKKCKNQQTTKNNSLL